MLLFSMYIVFFSLVCSSQLKKKYLFLFRFVTSCLCIFFSSVSSSSKCNNVLLWLFLLCIFFYSFRVCFFLGCICDCLFFLQWNALFPFMYMCVYVECFCRIFLFLDSHSNLHIMEYGNCILAYFFCYSHTIVAIAISDYGCMFGLAII